MELKIPARYGIELFINQGGFVVIQQETMGAEDNVAVHPDDIPLLISYLQKMRQEALGFEPEEEAE